MYRQIPNILTAMRLISAPLVALMLLISTEPFWSLIALIIYAIASATDWLDGYLARRWQSVSGFGRMLDPIADKLMVILILSAIMATKLVPAGISGLIIGAPALIIITREIMVSGLREFMAKQDFIVHVTWAAKMKTTIQLIAIGFLIGSFIFQPASDYAKLSYGVGVVGLWLAAALTAQTGIAYFSHAIRHMSAQK